MDTDNLIIADSTPPLQRKTLQAFQYVDSGLSPKEALQLTNFKENISREAVCKFREKYRKYSLTKPKMVKSAYDQIHRILAAEPREVTQEKLTKDGEIIEITEKIVPTDSNILAAAGMVYDRYEPVQPEQAPAGGNTYIDLTAITVQVAELSTGRDNEVNKAQVPKMIEISP